jgi:Zn-dependent protease with chaperone function
MQLQRKHTMTLALKRGALALSLCGMVGAAPAQPTSPANAPASAQAQVQDGIAVRPLSKWRYLQPEQVVDQQAAQQYAGLLSESQQKGVLVPAEHAQVQRLRAIARRLIPNATRWNPAAANWKWQVNLLESPQVNAFCMPGGRIAFYSGILTSLQLTDDEVAAVMGHEIAHALREHGRERAAKSSATNVVGKLASAGLSAWLGIDPRLTDTAAGAIGQLAVLKFSRDDEREADLIGLDLAARAGFDPRAGVALWRKMAALNQRAPLELLSTHPGGAERIDEIERNMGLLLPLYARARGTSADKLPAYRAEIARN